LGRDFRLHGSGPGARQGQHLPGGRNGDETCLPALLPASEPVRLPVRSWVPVPGNGAGRKRTADGALDPGRPRSLTAGSLGAQMRIGIDARFLMHGVGRYTEELLTHIAALDGTHTYYAFTSKVNPQAPSLDHLWGNRLREIPGRGSLYSPSE